MTGYGNGPGRTPTNPTEYYWLGAGATERLRVGDASADFPERFIYPRHPVTTDQYYWGMFDFKGPRANERYHGADFGDVFGGGGVASAVDFFDTNLAARRPSDLAYLYCVANWPQGVYDIHLHTEWGADNSQRMERFGVFMLEARTGNDALVAATLVGRTTAVMPNWDYSAGYPVTDLIVSDLDVAAPGGDVAGYYFAVVGYTGNVAWVAGSGIGSWRGYLRAERKG